MTNYSRTTLRELKKRYLNVLKKCLLANLSLILLSSPAMAEDSIVFDEVYENLVKEYQGAQGAILGRLPSTLGSLKFSNNVISSTANLQGGFGVVWTSDATFTGHVLVENNTFSSGAYGYGGFINVGNGRMLTLEKGEFINNTFEVNSGTVAGTIFSNERGVIHFKGDALFKGNTATVSGAAIYNQGPGTKNAETGQIEKYGITFDKTAIFLGNASISGSGGAIYNGNVYSGTILFQDDAYFGVQYNEDGTKTILGNEAVNGGAIYSVNGYSNQNGTIYNQYSTIDFKKKTEFVSNKATTAGGAIYNNSNMNFTDEAVFEGNIVNSETDTGQGGAIYNKGIVELNSADFIGNKTLASKGSASGGAIFKFGGKMSFSGDALFQDNIAQGGTDAQGGAIWNHTISSNEILSFQKAEFYNNQALQTKGSYNRGGAIWNNNKVVFNGEAIFGKYVLDESGNKTYDANGDVVTLGNKAISEQSGSSSGAIHHESGYGFMTFGQKATFIGNIADGYTSGSGGAIWTSAPGKLDENGVITEYGMEFGGEALFADNMAKAVTGLAQGGSIDNWQGSIRFNDHTTFNTNKVSSVNSNANGGAIYNSGTLNFTSADFIDNSSVAGNEGQGGAIYNESGKGNINFIGHAKFENNTVEGNATRGGAVYNNNSVIQFKSVEFINNTAISSNSLSAGGAIFNKTGSATIKQNVDEEGNAILDENGNPSLEPVYTYGMTFNGDTLFAGNKAESENGSAQGGAIFNQGYMLLAGKNTFDSNQAKQGGAICNTGGKKEGDVIAYGMTLGNSTFMNNTALSSGGAIYNTGYMNFTDEALFEGNEVESGVGSAISNKGFIYFTENTNFINNKSLGSHNANGAIYNDKNAIIKFNEHATFGGYKTDSDGEYVLDSEGNKISLGNTSTATTYSLGGAIYNAGDITFTSADFINNRALEAQEVHGGAIRNSGTILFNGDVLFQDNYTAAKRESYGGAIENDFLGTVDDNGKIIKYGMTFNGYTRFLSNYVTSVGFRVRGGAIYNYGSMFFGNQTLFEENSINITEGDSRNPAGGAVYNDTKGVIDFDNKTIFKGNSVYNSGANMTGGGAIYNKGILNFKNADFISNKGSSLVHSFYGQTYGAGIYNTGDSAQVTFTGDVLFKNNALVGTYTAQGGAIYNDSTKNTHGLIINGNAIFEGNKITTQMDDKNISQIMAQGGAIYNSGSLALKKDVLFKNNSVSGELAVSWGNVLAHGGAIYNSGTIDFDSGFTFTGNKTISRGVVTSNDIYNSETGTINFNHGLDKNGVALIGSLDGGIANSGTINKTGAGTLILGDKMVNSGAGTFNQTAGLTIAHADYFLTGTNNITGGELRVHGANMSNLKATVGGDALLTFLSTSTSEIEMKLGRDVSVAGDVKFGADDSVGTAKYHLKEDVTAKTITIQDSILTAENKEFNGVYEMGENVTLNMQDGDAADNVGFANLSGESSDLLFDIELKATTGEGLELASDKLSVQTPTAETYKVKVDLAKINVIGEVGDNGLNETYTTKVLEGEVEFETATNELKVFTDVYKYDVAVDDDKQSIKLSGIGASGENALKEAMDYEGNSAFKFSVVGKDYAFNSDTPITLGSGEKNIVGQGVDTSTIASGDKKLFVIDKENTNFKISDVALSGTGEIIENKAGSVTLEKVAIEGGKVINKDELTVEDSSVHVVENAGTLTATSSELGTVTNAGTLMLDTAEVSELENSGTLTAASSELGTVTNAGTLMLDTAEVSELENSGTLTANGSTIGALVNEHEATITGGELETATNKEKGMLSLSAGLRAGTVTNEGELTLDGVTVADLTNSATLKANGSTVQKLVNKQEAELTASTVKDLTNMGTLTAKDLTLKGALKGTGTATLSGKLVADDIFKSENKIISDGMEVSENVKKMELADLEIKSGTTLDIGTREVTAKEVSVGDKATLQVTLNNLDDHGTMKADKIEAGAGAGVHLVLGEKFEGGVFDVFKGTKGASDLEVKHNNLYNVIEVEEGKYSFMTKDTEALQESLGATKEEVIVAEAMTQGTASHEMFARMQSEVLVALQSLDTQTVEKAKKALSAVGAKEQPIEQSVASEHLVALQNVVQAELHGTTVGHSCGDTDPRAKVYIKGLYDRTKSSMGEGFRARSKGAVLGVQSEVTEALTLGVGYATSQTTAKEDLRRTEVDTNTGFISAHYQPNAWWVSGLATFSRGEYEEEKQILSSMGKATYDVDSWGAQVMTGYDIKLENAIITPEVGLRYLSVKQEGYTDTLGTTVSGTRSDYLTALVGVKGSWDMGAIRPTAGVTVGYDIISDEVSALNTLANGASYTINGEALDRLSTTVTTGIEADLGERTTLKLEYSGTYRKEYEDHSGMLKLEMKF